ncbi:MerR family DNA-binding transcriptional regulator [Clostridiaceae bacterium]|nr:MerR family DNA-binding transcriptional regulator [Clostridiaceae bacterium]
MLKIGEFSVLSQISIHMLRHYDEIGLLIPEHVDDFTGYRYYLKSREDFNLQEEGYGKRRRYL